MRVNTKKKITVYLCDLFHDYVGPGNYSFPLNIGFLASYIKKFYSDSLEIKLFKSPNKFLDALDSNPPDVIGFSHYTWGADLNSRMSKIAREKNQDVIITFGGPNLDDTKEGIEKFFFENPHADFYIPLQGEKPFKLLIEKVLDNQSRKKLKEAPIEGIISYNNDDKNIFKGAKMERVNLCEIPSPYLTGILDEFFEEKFVPIIETNRGCPYTCTFCAQGFSSENSLNFFNMEKVKEELEYIARKVKKTTLLMLADANFGIHKRDIEIAKFMKEIRDKTNYPRKFQINWAKNSNHRINQINEILDDSVHTVMSLQSLDTETLKNIKRTNIKSENYKAQAHRINEIGGVSATELIVGLPGETTEAHFDTLRKMFDWNVSYITVYNLCILDGTPMSMEKDREKYDLVTGFRLSDGCFGKYGDIYSFDHEEVVIGNNTMPVKELLNFRRVHWLIWFMWNYRFFYDFLKIFQSHGVNPIDFIKAFMESLDSSERGKVKQINDDFYKETYGEFHDSPKALREHFLKRENFEGLVNGEKGGKLNLKFQWRVILELYPEFSQTVLDTGIKLCKTHNLDIDEKQLSEVIDFNATSVLDFSSSEPHDLGEEQSKVYHYDFLAWRQNNYKKTLDNYYTGKGMTYRFYLDEIHKEALDKLIDQYWHDNKFVTYRKMGDYSNFTDLYYDIEIIGDEKKESLMVPDQLQI